VTPTAVASVNPAPVRALPARPNTPAARPKFLPLTGTHPCKLEDKNRLVLPERVREYLGDSGTLFLTPGPEACLWLTCAAGVERRADRFERDAAEHAEAHAAGRLHLAQTERVSADRTGRIAIPEHLAQLAGLRQDVVLIGANDHFEIWDAQRWQEYVRSLTAEPDR
jgi:MraZ protein